MGSQVRWRRPLDQAWATSPRHILRTERGGRLTLPAEGAPLSCFLISLDLRCSCCSPPASSSPSSILPTGVPGLQAWGGREI